MDELPDKLLRKLQQRQENNALRQLTIAPKLIDFSSNDYLGFASCKAIANRALELLKESGEFKNGATGSRLLTGNNRLFLQAENQVADFHKSPSALIYNSGYTANLGIVGSLPQRGDSILYDELVHASIREGILLSNAVASKFGHNNLEDLEKQLKGLSRDKDQEIYVITESVFSMDGDSPDLNALVALCRSYNCKLIIDEAHALGISQKGLVADEGLTKDVFARIITFGKALGCHGAAVLGSEDLTAYLLNFSRSFIYSTALPPHSVATLLAAYERLESEPGRAEIKKLNSNIAIIRSYIKKYKLMDRFLPSTSAVQSMLVPGNEQVKRLSERLMADGFDIRPIMSPTVPRSKERIRICLHSFNTKTEIEQLMQRLAIFAR
jgi:8-amino-7-oxononanoate synthase